MAKQLPGDSLRSAGIKPITAKSYIEQYHPNVQGLQDGERINEAIAERLFHATGISKKFWFDMQEACDNHG